MKKWILLLLCFCAVNSVYAQEKLSLAQRVDQQQLDLVNRQDEMLEFLLQIPFEQRQYIFPMLSEKQSVPKKIKTHPDVLVWKGKRPTRIAKRFQNDPELLEFLPAQFYYFIAPEMWPDEDAPSLEKNPNKLLINFMRSGPNDSVASEKMIQLKNGLDITYKSLSDQQKDRLKNPSEIYLSNLLTFNAPQLAEKLKKQGYKSPQEFAKSVDLIASVYRQYKKGKNPLPSPEQELVKNYFSLIPFIFKKTGFSALLDMNNYSD